MGEQGTDGGGLTREFFTLVTRHCSRYMESTGCFKHNSLALQVIMCEVQINNRMIWFPFQDGVFTKLGQLMAMALVHGGSAVEILSRSVFNFLSGMKPFDIIVDIDEIPEADVRDVLSKVSVQYYMHYDIP